MKVNHRPKSGLSILFGFSFALSATLFAADYEIVEKQDQIQVESTSFASEHHRLVVKILTSEGAGYREYLSVNSYIQIKNIDVTVVSSEGASRKMKSEDIVEVPVVDSPDMITDFKAIVIAPQDLTPGSIVRIEYDRNVTNLLYLDRWVYASNVPIRKASCSVTYPVSMPMKFRGEDSSVRVQKSEKTGVNTILMDTANQTEVFLRGVSGSIGAVEKKVVFLPEQCMTEKWQLSTKSWEEVAQWFSELTKFAYHEDPSMDPVVQDIKSRYKTPEEVADALYQYVQKNFSYTAIEIGIGGYKPRFVSQTFLKKYGDCKDLSFLFIALLKKAGIEAYPALVDTRHSKFFYRDFPSPTQFNHCIAYLPKIRNGVWADSTVKNFRLGEVPAVIQGKQALVSGGPNTLIQIPEDLRNSNVMRFELSGSFAEPVLQMSGSVHTLGQANVYVDAMRNALLKNAVKNYVYSNLLMPGFPVQKLETHYSNERELKFSYHTPVQALDHYRLFLINAVSYPPLENRAQDPQPNEFYSLGVPIRLVVESTIDLAGHVLVSSAVSREKKGEFVTYSVDLREESGKLKYLTDAYFANGFLNDSEMKTYRQELEEFSARIVRTVIVR